MPSSLFSLESNKRQPASYENIVWVENLLAAWRGKLKTSRWTRESSGNEIKLINAAVSARYLLCWIVMNEYGYWEEANHEFMNKCDCICIWIQLICQMKGDDVERSTKYLLLLFLLPAYSIGNIPQNQTKSREYYSILSSVYSVHTERRKKKEHDEDSSWLAILLFTHSAHCTCCCWPSHVRKLPRFLNSPDTRDDDERIVNSTLKLT